MHHTQLTSSTADFANTPDSRAGNSYRLAPSRSNSGWGVFILFCVLLPFGSVAVELVCRGCSDLLFDPLPTVWHAIDAACVPLFNLIIYGATADGRVARPHLLRWLNTIAIGSAIYFCVAFLPVAPIGLIGILAFGLGLLVLGPYFALIGALRCRSRLRQATPAMARTGYRWHVLIPLTGLALPLAVLGGQDVRRALTLQKFSAVVKPATPEEQASAVASLRQWGDERAMLEACFGQWSRTSMHSGWRFMTDPSTLSVLEATAAYYRVTGREANQAALAKDWRWGGRNRFRGGWDSETFDEGRGGENVGKIIPGLSLNASAMTGTIHADAATFYGEWILEFRNVTSEQQEARCRVLLPEGGVVSRVTLWINGEEREAAYGSRGKVRKAYQSVAVVQRRDPVLVTHCGRNRVMLQCFPVPPGGTIKTKIGIAAPLRLNMTADRGLLTLPCLLEQNFAVAASEKEPTHTVTVESGQPMETATPAATTALRLFSTSAADGSPRFEMSGTLSNPMLSSRVALAATRRPARTVAFAEDPFDAEKRLVVQTVTPTARTAIGSITVVVDGSAGMAAQWSEMCDAVAALDPRINVRGVIAADEIIESSAAAPGGGTLAASMRSYTPAGGQDAVPALQRALDLTGPEGLVLWLRAVQPVDLSSTTPLEARLAARPNFRLLEVPVGPGHNRVADALAQAGVIDTAPWSGSLAATLRDVVAAETTPTKGWRLNRVLQKAAPSEPDAIRGNINLARVWAAEEVDRRLRSGIPADRDVATKLAVGHQLVTPVSGAVVLETKEQYAQHDLSAAPAAPLPPAAWAALLMLPLLLLARRWMNRPCKPGG